MDKGGLLYYILFIYSVTDGHLGYFHILVSINNAAVHILYHCTPFFKIYDKVLKLKKITKVLACH